MSELSSAPQSGVDANDKKADVSRAPAHKDRTPPGAEAVFALAHEIASNPRLADSTLREIILAHPTVRLEMVAAAVRCLHAEKFYFDRASKDIVHEPDYATQIKAITWLAAYSDGLPVQTNLNVNANAQRGKKTPTEIMATPATIAAMERALAAAKEELARVQKGGGKTAASATSENEALETSVK